MFMSFSDVVWSLVGIGAVAVAGLLAWDYYQKQVTTQQQQQASQPFRSWICQVTGVGCPSGSSSTGETQQGQENDDFWYQLTSKPNTAQQAANQAAFQQEAGAAFSSGNYQTFDTGAGTVGITVLPAGMI
jgi:predicted negative regulator of RcsB-dependent stress response